MFLNRFRDVHRDLPVYPKEDLNQKYGENSWGLAHEDDGTMPANVQELATAVVGHKIVSAEKIKIERPPGSYGNGSSEALVLTLDDGTRVALRDSSDCCAYTDLQGFLLHPESVDHVIMGVGTTNEYNTWHIYADFGDIMALQVGWSCGNPFYYGYGFDIDVYPVEDQPLIEEIVPSLLGPPSV